MKEASPKFNRKTSKAFRNATSLQASVDGASQLGLQDGRTKTNCGQDRARVNLSAQPGGNSHNSTSATYGLSSSVSSEPKNLTELLASKLQQRLGTIGSTECSLTWKERTTPAGRSFFQLVPSTPRTGETVFGLWPTPTARDWKDSGKNANYKKIASKHKLAGIVVFVHGGGSSNAAEMESIDGLHPEFLAWLMGFPPEWNEVSPLATPSSRK